MSVAKEQIRQIIADNNLNSVADVYTLLSVGSDVQVVSGTLESIENTGFFNAFLFCPNKKLKIRGLDFLNIYYQPCC